MARSPLALTFTFVAAAGLAAQQPAAKPLFHLPAGEYSIAELLDKTEQAMHKAIARGADAEDASKNRIRLQAPLALDPAAWHRVLAALVSTQGLVVTFDPQEKRHEVLLAPARAADWIRERAEECTLAELFAGGRYAPVRVPVPTAFAAVDAQNALGPMAVVRNLGFVDFEGEPGHVTATGLADVVRQALAELAKFEPTLAAALPRPAAEPWPRAMGEWRIELAKGEATVRELIDGLAAARGVNIVTSIDAERLGKKVAIEETRHLDAFACEDEVTRALWSQGVLVVPLLPGAGLFEAIATGTPRFAAVPRLDLALSPAEVLARPRRVAFASVAIDVDDATRDAVAASVRKVMTQGGAPAERGAREVSFSMSGGKDRFVLTGLTTELHAVCTELARPAAK